ncbi:MAG: VirK/YbjX family protein [Selenomonadaceae bacterium]|nr:VirK/YbjX family protein [Selenomonadaceae bacterium]
MLEFIDIGKKIYDVRKSREARRYVVFLGRCVFNCGRMARLREFFQQTPLLAQLAEIYPFVYEQPGRAFFYNKSNFKERAELVEQHISYLAKILKPEVLLDIYREKDMVLWQQKAEAGTAKADAKVQNTGGGKTGDKAAESVREDLKLVLGFYPGQRKEGLLAVSLLLDNGDGKRHELYQIIFWIRPDANGEMSMWIGAMQGPNMEDSKDVIKRITKRCHAYRTKNLILHAAQEVAKALDLKHIYAVTNYGYYANNHVRVDRKLKTSFSDFWGEAGGTPCEDKRFFSLPMEEYRKSMEEVPTRKRAVYRRRFALMDEIDEAVAASVKDLRQ